jgi:competence protein ComEC
MARWTLGFLFGVMAITRCAVLPPVWISYLLFSGSLIILCSLYYKSIIVGIMPTFLLAVSFGASWALCVAQYQLNHRLPAALENQTVEVTGQVDTFPEYQNSKIQFNFLIDHVQSSISLKMPLRVRLSWQSFHSQKQSLPNLKKGERYQLLIRLKSLRGFWTPGSFDREADLFQKKIQAIGYVLKGTRLAQAPYSLIDSLRARLTTNVQTSLADSPFIGLVTALTTGVRYQITSEQWQVMRGTGTNHLFAISGLHLAFMAGMVYWLILAIWRWIPSAALRIPNSQIAAALSGLFAIFYSALSGWALPVQRALCMLWIGLLAKLLRRHLSYGHTLYSALGMMLLLSPFSVLSASFWLSFGAVAFILYGVLGRLRPKKDWRASLRIQANVGLGLLPLSLLFFQQISWVSFPANFLAIPVVGFLILPISLIGSFLTLLHTSSGKILLLFTEKIFALLWSALTYLSGLSALQYQAAIASPFILMVSLVGLILLCAPPGVPGRFFGVFLLLPLFYWQPKKPQSGEIWIHLLDVGQGLATVIQTAHHQLIYDTGPSRGMDTGRVVLIPFLQQKRIKEVDTLIVSHGDDDHSGGAKSLLAYAKVNRILTSVPNKFPQQGAVFCEKGMHWHWDGVDFQILHPPSHQSYWGNESSCVLKITSSGHRVLLTGDIEYGAEQTLVRTLPKQLAADILVVPHHGSKTSSSEAFLDLIKPNIALFSTGYHNRYHHPHPQIVERYRQRAVTCYDTAIEGAITLKLSDGKKPLIETYRQRYRGFWQVN